MTSVADGIRQTAGNLMQEAALRDLQYRIPSVRGAFAWQMADSPEQQQQWRAWANNPSMHNPQQMGVDPATGQPFRNYEQYADTLRNQVYGGPMSQPTPRGVPRGQAPTRQVPGLTAMGGVLPPPKNQSMSGVLQPPKNQVMGRILRQAGK